MNISVSYEKFKALLLQVHEKCGIDKSSNVVLNKRIYNLHKVSVILKDKLPERPWDIKGLNISKALLTTNEVLLGPTNHDTAPKVRKSKKGKPAAPGQSEAHEKYTGTKRKLKSKDLAKRPKKLRPTKLTFDLED